MFKNLNNAPVQFLGDFSNILANFKQNNDHGLVGHIRFYVKLLVNLST